MSQTDRRAAMPRPKARHRKHSPVLPATPTTSSVVRVLRSRPVAAGARRAMRRRRPTATTGTELDSEQAAHAILPELELGLCRVRSPVEQLSNISTDGRQLVFEL